MYSAHRSTAEIRLKEIGYNLVVCQSLWRSVSGRGKRPNQKFIRFHLCL